jgi:hypothetical protein
MAADQVTPEFGLLLVRFCVFVLHFTQVVLNA